MKEIMIVLGCLAMASLIAFIYETLTRLLIKKKRKDMDMNSILEVFGHLDECGACR